MKANTKQGAEKMKKIEDISLGLMKKIEDMTKRELADALMGATAARRFWAIQASELGYKGYMNLDEMKSEYNNAKLGYEELCKAEGSPAYDFYNA